MNQLKVGGIGTMFATERQSEATLGGSALKFHTVLRLRMQYGRKYLVKNGKKKDYIGFEVRAMVTKDKARAAGIHGRDAVLVFRTVGSEVCPGGLFSDGLSAMRTLQEWGFLSKSREDGRVALAKTLYTPLEWEAAYVTDTTFRERVQTLLEVCSESLVKKAKPLKEATLGAVSVEEEDDEEEL